MSTTHTFGIFVAIILASSTVSADPLKARRDYERHCAACHGLNGTSVNPEAPNLRFNQGLLQSDMQIVQKLKMGSPKKPPMAGLLSDQDLLQIVLYARTLR